MFNTDQKTEEEDDMKLMKFIIDMLRMGDETENIINHDQTNNTRHLTKVSTFNLISYGDLRKNFKALEKF